MDKLVEDIRKKFKNGRLRTNKNKTILEIESISDEKKIQKMPQPPTVSEAKKALLLNNDLKDTFRNARIDAMNNIETKERAFEPVTKGLADVVKALKQSDVDIKRMAIEPVINRLNDIKRKSSLLSESTFRPALTSSPNNDEKPLIELDADVKKTSHRMLNLSANEDIEPDEVTLNDSNRDTTMLKIVENQKQNTSVGSRGIGVIARDYILHPDRQFGIYPGDKDTLHIGNKKVVINGNDIIIDDLTYKGSHGLWKLLTKVKEYPEENEYTNEDLVDYKNILIQTCSMLQNNNPSTKYPKASTNKKWTHIVGKVWSEYKTKGKGLIEYNGKPVSLDLYNSKDLLKRLSLILGEEAAGNNNTHNEKLAVLNSLFEILEKSIDKPETIQGLMILTKTFSEKIDGKGVFNYLLNNLNNYTPGYELDKTLARGDVLDEHDIFYRTHKDVNADKVTNTIIQNRWENLDAKKRMFGIGLRRDVF